VRQRILSGGLDRPLVTRLVPSAGSAARNMAFLADRQGTTLAAVHPSGLRDETAAYFGRNAFGTLEGASGTGSSSNPETGFTGASTPNQTGGFTYLRNRWYDPQSGRFLTQDPIGLAGGVNLYAYAGNNPVSFSDPFGLCQKCVSNDDDGGGSCDYDEDGSEAPSEIAAHNSVHATSALGQAAWDALGIFNTALELPGVKEGVQVYASLRQGKPVAAGQTSSGRSIDKYGNKIGPSGQLMVNRTTHNTLKGAKDAARASGNGAPVKHSTPRSVRK
jgi:RHS repeat-associated protein